MSIISMQCHCCGSEMSDAHPGFIINEHASLGSRLVGLKEQAVRLAGKKPNPPLLTKVELEDQKRKLQEQIEECEKDRKLLAAILHDWV